MRRKFSGLTALFLTVLLMAGLVGCGERAATGADPQAAENLDPIKIGLCGIMTGPNAENGEYTSGGAKLAVEEINAAGGVQVPGENGKRMLELCIEDDQGTADVGLNAIAKLIDEHQVVAFLGPDYSGVAYAGMFLAEEAEVPQITSAITAKICREGNKYIFRGRSYDELWMKDICDYLVGEMGYTKIGVTFTNNELGKNGADLAESYLKEKYNIDIMCKISHNSGDKDLSASATKVVQLNPEVLINWGTQIEASLLIRDLRASNWDGVFAFQAADDIFVNLAQENSVGVIGPQNWVYTLDDEASVKFTEAYKAMNGKVPSPHSVVYYDGVYMIARAIEEVGTNPKDIRNCLAGMTDFVGVEGLYQPGNFAGGEMSSKTVLIQYNEDLVPEPIKIFE